MGKRSHSRMSSIVSPQDRPRGVLGAGVVGAQHLAQVDEVRILQPDGSDSDTADPASMITE